MGKLELWKLTNIYILYTYYTFVQYQAYKHESCTCAKHSIP